ncbi:LLM class flavin-dependent oxidoreductase [Rhodococcus opacus]|uniref:Monooxygenase n=1 Tax=Rhodococcus opacus TaxID=37919 RepID=A0A076EZV9_RHOOP|nr:LLM class flavin-dependent oxidoreductase [Rhodococcus opacus]AII10963.1 monooxygenase [Rhodococcus opacus]
MVLSERTLHLNVNITNLGRQAGAWRLLDDPAAFIDVDFYRTIAQVAEQGTFDAVFLSDALVLLEEPPMEPFQSLEPTVLLTALAAVTERIGLIATASTTFNEPFNLARRLASLDHVSRGRAALNLVTTFSPGAAANFNDSGPSDHGARYARAEEFTDVLCKLWDSWDDGAIIGDREGRRLFDAAHIHPVDHVGAHYSVRGPALVPRSPQGRPVLVQAGSSDVGRAFGSRVADAIFTSQTTFRGAQDFYADMKARAVTWGRNPDHVVVLPGLYVVVGSTEEEAHRRKENLDAMFDLDHESAKLAERLGLTAGDLALDQELPFDKLNDVEKFPGSHGFFESTVRLAYENNLTVHQLLLRNAGAHHQVVGGPEQIADTIEAWFRNGAADGFNINFDLYPSGLETFTEHVIPVLRERGLFRHEYTGTTLRDHLGIPRPPSQYAIENAE